MGICGQIHIHLGFLDVKALVSLSCRHTHTHRERPSNIDGYSLLQSHSVIKTRFLLIHVSWRRVGMLSFGTPSQLSWDAACPHSGASWTHYSSAALSCVSCSVTSLLARTVRCFAFQICICCSLLSWVVFVSVKSMNILRLYVESFSLDVAVGNINVQVSKLADLIYV